MAAARKPAVDPLVEELPPTPELKPGTAADVKFEVQITPYVIGGKTNYRWEILDHSHKGYVGDYAGHRDAGFESGPDAEDNAAAYVDRIRQAVELKLNAPDAYRITL